MKTYLITLFDWTVYFFIILFFDWLGSYAHLPQFRRFIPLAFLTDTFLSNTSMES